MLAKNGGKSKVTFESRQETSKEKKQRQAQERAQARKKKHLAREIQLSILNSTRYRKLWRDMMLEIKMPSIKEDIEVAWRTFDRALDIKNHSIQLLTVALDDAEVQYGRMKSNHIEVIDHLLEVYKNKIGDMATTYKLNLDSTMNEVDTASLALTREYNESTLMLDSIIHATQQQIEDLLSNTKSSALSKTTE